ncbi:helix-turn-helix domain-containing protein [Nocardiopsis sp. CNT-189]|uniref:BldC family transcriptional regulator n=1 Tax=Nocardiopsis oceanisediminis TaxID=2816862 RepID=UPI003B379194
MAIVIRTTSDTSASSDEAHRLLTPAEVAQIFRVDPKTVTRWAKAGKLTAIRTLGGHRRYPADQFERLLSVEQAGGER